VYCEAFSEHVVDEKVAEECVAFDPIPANVITEWEPRPDLTVVGFEPADVPMILTASSNTSTEVQMSMSRHPTSTWTATVMSSVPARPAVESEPEPAAELVRLCEAFLKERHTTLYGQVFEIISPKGRAHAASWLAEQITAITQVKT
jgi:hypothetical protein